MSLVAALAAIVLFYIIAGLVVVHIGLLGSVVNGHDLNLEDIPLLAFVWPAVVVISIIELVKYLRKRFRRKLTNGAALRGGPFLFARAAGGAALSPPH